MLSASALMLALMLAGMGGVSAETYVGAGLDSFEGGYDWNETGSPYVVNKTICVEKGRTLTIGPNVIVAFDPGCQIIVNGTLVVKGTEAQPVVFDANTSSPWAGIQLNAGSVGSIDHAIINNTECAIDVADCKLVVTNTIITNTAKAVYAEFDVGGSLTIDSCFIDAQYGPGASIAILMDASADGVHKNVTSADVTITNNLVNSTNPEGLLSISRSANAEGKGVATLVGDILVSGNEFNLLASDANLALFIDHVLAEGEGAATVRGDITYSDNLAYVAGDKRDGMIRFERTVNSHNSSAASLIGDITISGNRLDQTSTASGPIIISSVLEAYGNSTVEVVGEVCLKENVCEALVNSMLYCYFEAIANDNSTMFVNVPVKVSNNIGYSIFVVRGLQARGNASMDATIPTCVQYNTVRGAIAVYSTLDAQAGNATIAATGDVMVYRNNVKYSAEIGSPCLISVYVDLLAECNGAQQDCKVVYDADAVVTENELFADPHGPIDADAYGIEVHTCVYAGHPDSVSDLEGSTATATLGNVLITKNIVTILAISEGHTSYGLFIDPDVYADATFGLVSCATSGGVFVEQNEVVIDGDNNGNNVGIYLHTDHLYAAANGEGSVATALSGPWLIRNNLVDMSGGSNIGIRLDAYEDAYADAKDGAIAELRMTSGVVVSRNEISIDGKENSGIRLNSYQESLGEGGEARYELPFTISDNSFEMKGISGTAIDVVRFESYVRYIGGDAGLAGSLTIEGNRIVMIGPGSSFAPGAPPYNSQLGIQVDADSHIDPASNNGAGSLASEVCIIDNTIAGAEYGIYLSGITEVAVLVKDNVVTGALSCLSMSSCIGIELRGNTFKGGEYGIYANDIEGTLIEGNAFIENDFGLYLSGDVDTIVRDNFFSKNGQQGLRADGSVGLVIEDCYFYFNGGVDRPLSGGARLTGVTASVVGNNTFYMNLNGGLRILGSELVLYNGEYDQNRGIGLNVNGGSVDWIVDRRAVVHANNVNFAGEIVVSGKLVLDLSDLEMRPDGDVVNGVYDGCAHLKVAEGGCLEAYNSRLGGSSNPWFFDVYGTMRLTNCVVSEAYEVYLGETSNVEMTTTTIEDAYGSGVRIVGCSPTIRGCIVTGSGMDGVYVADGAKPTIVGCTIVGNGRGIYAFESSLDMVVDNVIVMNSAGIYAERVTGTVHDNVMMLNGIELFLIDCDVDVMYNQFGYGRLIEMNEPLASALIQAVDELLGVSIDLGGLKAPDIDDLLSGAMLPALDGSVGIYAINSSVCADSNEYGRLQTAVYLMRSDLVFSDVIRTNPFDMRYANGTRVLSIPFTVYDGIYAVDSTLTIRNASIQVVDDAIFLENSDALIVDSVFDAGDFDLYAFRDSEAAVCGDLDKYAILDSSKLYWLAELTIKVVDQDGWGIAGASVVVKDANGRVWSQGTTDRLGVLVAHAPHSLETKNGVSGSLGKSVVTASFEDQASYKASVDVVGDEQLTLKMTMKKNSVFGMDPLVLGVVALVIIVVIVGAMMLARKS